MKDFHFWVGLPYILQEGVPELQSQSSSLRQELETLENRIRNTKNQLLGLMSSTQFTSFKPEDKEKLKVDFSSFLREMELKKNQIITFAINATLQNLKQIIAKFEANEKISGQALQLGLKLSRAIVDKSIQEFKECANEKEKQLYLMLKVYGEKCLEKFVVKINEILQDFEASSDGSIEEEDNGLDEENLETSTTYTARSKISVLGDGKFVGSEASIDLLI